MQTERVSALNENDLPALRWNFQENPLTPESATNFLINPDNYLLVTRRGDQILGILRAHYTPRLDIKSGAICLLEIDVHPEYRQQGAGTALIEKLKQLAQERNIHEIWAVSNVSNTAAASLYKNTGAVLNNKDNAVFEWRL